jgi:hypothetical protein
MKDTFTGIEFFDIVSRGKTLLNFTGEDINGKSIREIELIIGEKLGEGVYSFSKKVRGEPKKKNGRIRGVILGTNKSKNDNSNNGLIELIQKEFNSNNRDEVLKLNKQLYETRIQYLKDMNEDLKKELTELKQKHNDLKIQYDKILLEDPGEDKQTFLDELKPFIPMIAKKFGLLDA